LLCGAAAKQKRSLASRCYQNTKNVKNEVQSFFFDQKRVAVLVKAVFLLPLPGKRKLIPALAFLPWRPSRLGGKTGSQSRLAI
jgi:hypothetical protein